MIIGVDLGTTNSLVAAWKDGEPQVIPNVLGDRLTPSVVGLDDNGDVLVGLPARQRLITHPDKTAAAFKRHMGTEREYGLGQRQFRPEELSSLVLRALKADAEHWLGETVDKAISDMNDLIEDRDAWKASASDRHRIISSHEKALQAKNNLLLQAKKALLMSKGVGKEGPGIHRATLDKITRHITRMISLRLERQS